MKLLVILSLILLQNLIVAQLSKDSITMPGWPSGYKNSFSVYSGYLNSINGKTHYMFLTKQDTTTPENFPIVLWINGGKGCSSLQGLIQEMGPYRLLYPSNVFASTTTLQNEYAWNKQANLLLFETPLNTGFSKYTGTSTYAPGDLQTVEEIYTSLKEFFSLNPTYNKAKVILAGEGLAGQFIPHLGIKIKTGNQGKILGDTGYINLFSVLLGNAMLKDNKEADFFEYYHNLQYLDEHGVYGDNLDEIWYSCASDDLTDPTCEYFDEVNAFTRIQLNPYNIYEDCQKKPSESPDFNEDISESAYCISWNAIENYFNSSTNQAALNIDTASKPYWQVCHIATQMNYKNVDGGSMDQVVSLIKDHGVYVILYSGLSDSTIPYHTTESYYTKIKKEIGASQNLYLEPFITKDQQLGGWTTTAGKLQYIKVRAAGHQVPLDQPAAAYLILKGAISGEAVD